MIEVIEVIEVALQIKAPEVQKELDLLSESKTVKIVAVVALQIDGAALKTRIFKSLVESWLRNLEMMKIEKVSFYLIILHEQEKKIIPKHSVYRVGHIDTI